MKSWIFEDQEEDLGVWQGRGEGGVEEKGQVGWTGQVSITTFNEYNKYVDF